MKQTLLHPQNLDMAYFRRKRVKRWLEKRIVQVAANPVGHRARDAITVLIRTRNDEDNIATLLEEIKNQDTKAKIEIIVVDTESTDKTREIARRYGAKIVPITQKEFTYPKSLNLGFEAASHDAVFCVVGHTNLASPETLPAAIQQIESGAAGAYGKQLINRNATRTERIIHMPKIRPHAPIKETYAGVLSGNCSVVSKKVWKELGGFSEDYAHGGEDTELAKRMLEAGYMVVFDPALSTHHTHGLGPIDVARQFKHWAQILHGPGRFDTVEVLKRRPDLRKKFK